jgi:hypothetical protein
VLILLIIQISTSLWATCANSLNHTNMSIALGNWAPVHDFAGVLDPCSLGGNQDWHDLRAMAVLGDRAVEGVYIDVLFCERDALVAEIASRLAREIRERPSIERKHRRHRCARDYLVRDCNVAMGKKQHQSDKLYLTQKEWWVISAARHLLECLFQVSSTCRVESFGGKKANIPGGAQAAFRRLPFDCCALSLQPFEHPVCAPDGTVYELLNIMPFVKKHGVNPATGEKLDTKDLVRLHYSR